MDIISMELFSKGVTGLPLCFPIQQKAWSVVLQNNLLKCIL